MDWFERLTVEGKCARRLSLEDKGKVVSGKQRIVSDGPFAESKEAIAGCFLLTVANEKEAIESAKQCPALEYGSVVGVRPVGEISSGKQRAEEYSKAVVAGARA
jgi:hypothetical protein